MKGEVLVDPWRANKCVLTGTGNDEALRSTTFRASTARSNLGRVCDTRIELPRFGSNDHTAYERELPRQASLLAAHDQARSPDHVPAAVRTCHQRELPTPRCRRTNRRVVRTDSPAKSREKRGRRKEHDVAPGDALSLGRINPGFAAHAPRLRGGLA